MATISDFKSVRVYLMASFFVLLSFSAQTEEHENDVFANVNGQKVTVELLRFLAGSRQMHLGSDDKQTKSKAAHDLLVTELLAQEALKLGIHRRNDFIVEMEMARKTLLAQLYVQKFLQRVKINQDDIKQRYDALPQTHLYRFKVLDTPSRAEAEKLLASLIGKVTSTEAMNALGFREGPWLSVSDLPESLKNNVAKLERNGLYDQPVWSGKTWQLVQLLDKQTFSKSEYEKQGPIIESELRAELLDMHIAEFMNNAEIEIVNDLGFGVEHVYAQ